MGIFKKIIAQFRGKSQHLFPHLIRQDHHVLSRQNIDENALKVLYRLHEVGFQSYLVGGSVRDLLLGRTPKDFDVVTNAHPEQVRKLFRNSRLIGRRFKLVHVFYEGDIIEVSTFRGGQTNNTYGRLEEDVWRRDFTINALYYNIADGSVVDYTQGVKDLEQRVIRMIGDPATRLQEDPVRILRAIRLSAKLDFAIAPEIETLFVTYGNLLSSVSSARLFDEILKLFFGGNALVTYHTLLQYDFVKIFFPQTVKALATPHSDQFAELIREAMLATDTRFTQKQPLNPGYLFAVLAWPVLQKQLNQHPLKKKKFSAALHSSVIWVIAKQLESLKIPKRYTSMMRDMWMLQYHLKRKRGRRVYRTLNRRYYRAGIDFMALRSVVGEPVGDLVKWWRTFETATNEERQAMCGSLDVL